MNDINKQKRLAIGSCSDRFTALETAHRIIRFSDLSAPRRTLLRLSQLINFGEIRDIEVRKREPVFGSASLVLVDVRLDVDEMPRHEASIADFTLCAEFCRLLAQLDEIEDGRIHRIEVRAGLPRRLLFESQVGRRLP